MEPPTPAPMENKYSVEKDKLGYRLCDNGVFMLRIKDDFVAHFLCDKLNENYAQQAEIERLKTINGVFALDLAIAEGEIKILKSERLDAGEAIGLVNWVIDTRPSRILTPDELIAAFRAAQNEKK